MLTGPRTMTLLIPIGALAAAFMGFALLTLYRQVSGRPSVPENADWLEDLSTERYRPMLRLLARADLDFLRSQPGFTRALAARLRKQRCRIFRGYLKSLSGDFRCVCWAVKILMVQSHQDRPELAGQLLRSQAAFAWGILVAQTQVVFYGWGLGTVDMAALLKVFDGMRLELRSLTPAAMPSAA